jgi:DNA-binding NtrC family response regulator
MRCTMAGKESAMCVASKVLVIDDDEVVRRSYARSLAQTACQVATADNGETALKCMRQEASDVVLLDLRMPGMDGLAVLRILKRDWPDSEVIVITGYPALDSAKQAVALGAYDYLSKPTEPRELVRVTTSAAQHKRWALHRESRSDSQPAFSGEAS